MVEPHADLVPKAFLVPYSHQLIRHSSILTPLQGFIQASFNPKDSYVKSGIGQNAFRTIFGKCELDEFEEKEINDFDQLIKSKSIKMPEKFNSFLFLDSFVFPV